MKLNSEQIAATLESILEDDEAVQHIQQDTEGIIDRLWGHEVLRVLADHHANRAKECPLLSVLFASICFGICMGAQAGYKLAEGRHMERHIVLPHDV